MKEFKEVLGMKELRDVLAIVAMGLKSLSDGLETIAKKVDDVAASIEAVDAETENEPIVAEQPITNAKETSADEETAQTAQPKSKATEKIGKRPRKKVSKKTTSKRNNKMTKPANQVIYDLIAADETGVSLQTITEATKFDRKKISNTLQRLKQKNKIANKSKGLYVIIDEY